MSDLVAEAQSVLGRAWENVPELRSAIARLENFRRSRLFHLVRAASADPDKLIDENDRIVIARFLTAFLPDSLPTVTGVLGEADPGVLRAELCFSLFVAFQDVPSFKDSSTVAAVERVVVNYLEFVKTDDAQAAWMAGDLLGDHWALDTALPALIRLGSEARWPAGREGALHGLSHALNRASKREQWQVVAALRVIATRDTNEGVRSYANAVLGDLRGF